MSSHLNTASAIMLFEYFRYNWQTKHTTIFLQSLQKLRDRIEILSPHVCYRDDREVSPVLHFRSCLAMETVY